MVTLEKDISQSKEIIRRFDEILSEKAGKVAVAEINHKFSAYLKTEVYKKYRAGDMERVEAFDSKIESLRSNFEKLHFTSLCE